MEHPPISGAAAVLRTLASAGVRHVFANPGTTELAFLPAFADRPDIQPVLVVDETVASGAADGVARMTGTPAATLLHLGPGLANAGANLHNARKAQSPTVNIVGDHANGHRDLPSPLQSDIAGLAAPLSCWVGEVTDADHAAAQTAAAVQAALRHHAPATLIVTADAAAATTAAAPPAPLRPPPAPTPDPDAVRSAAAAIRAGTAALLLGGDALRATSLSAAAAIAGAHSVDLWVPMFNARVEHPGNLAAPLRKLPYFPAQAAEVLGRYSTVIRIGAERPVAMFAYPGEPTVLRDDDGPALDGTEGAVALAAELGVVPSATVQRTRPPTPEGAIDLFSIGVCIGATAPDHLIVVDEGQTSSLGLWEALARVPHDLLALTGGAIGSGPPLAVGAALAAPGRRVVNLQGDGSALYSLGAWWTQAALGLPITTVVADNGGYTILDLELGRMGRPDLSTGGLTSLRMPPLDFVRLAEGYGVPGARVSTTTELCDALRRAAAAEGPFVIHAAMK